MAYLHGAYGELGDSKVQSTVQANAVAGYIGTAPINLVRGYADADLINMPIRVKDMLDVQSKLGYAEDWSAFTLCEVFAQHFQNTVGNVGPIYVINVLDPDVHVSDKTTNISLPVVNGRAEIESTTIILDTLALTDMVEGVDYTLDYNFAKGTAIIKVISDKNVITLGGSYKEVDASKITSADIIGAVTAAGEYTGLNALTLLYQHENAVLNLLAAPGWSHDPAVYKAMVAIVQKLNGHWDGFVNADIPLVDSDGAAIDTIEKAIAWKAENGYTSEFSKVYWPQVMDGSGKVSHLSTVGQATMLRVDLSHDSIPFESPSNKEIMATRQYFGENSKNKGYDQQTCNSLNEKGITTACFWAGQWVLWGPHTAAYSYGGSMDARSIFESNVRMLMHITNNFQLEHGTRIDSPMTPQLKDTILNREREKLDTLCGIGAIIGTPTVDFLESANPINNMVNGDFVWDVAATTTPPFKSGKVRVSYTDEGFAAFFGE